MRQCRQSRGPDGRLKGDRTSFLPLPSSFGGGGFGELGIKSALGAIPCGYPDYAALEVSMANADLAIRRMRASLDQPVRPQWSSAPYSCQAASHHTRTFRNHSETCFKDEVFCFFCSQKKVFLFVFALFLRLVMGNGQSA
jgi:hypothetical protein